MCDYIKVKYKCGHIRYIVRAWCTQFVRTQGTQRCGVNTVGDDQHLDDCGDCR
ncbi:hypothetical protein FN846DRAFT_905141 [Sphaerosporella brunnea]|uniref:Uncharacterized protein n=1 Tax=Sphaerosporella brunnea TaxID=1250544 RepID=A0A5J5F2T5_9PEZI|nr:hypothetical protein FN846DRAFT_905141 [Sphaerosporella brunnea]